MGISRQSLKQINDRIYVTYLNGKLAIYVDLQRFQALPRIPFFPSTK